MKSRLAFTLVEMLVASSLAIFLLSLVTGTMLHINRITARTNAVLNMHDAVAGFQRILQDRFQPTHHGTSWHAEASPGADALWDSGDESFSLTWMAAISNRNEVSHGLYSGDQDDLAWFRLAWRGPTHASQPGLFLARTLPRSNTSINWGQFTAPGYPNVYYFLGTWAQPRRDRRRDMDDNDMRNVEGIPANIYTNNLQPGGLWGDSKFLDYKESAAFTPDMKVEDFALAWVDRQGWTTSFSPKSGLSRRDETGTNQPLLGQPWDNQTVVRLDGMYLDARAHVLAPDPRDINACRPALVRLAFSLRVEPPPGASLKAREDIVQRFTLSIPLGPGLPHP